MSRKVLCFDAFYAEMLVFLTPSYEEVFPSKRHKAAGKETGETNRIERFNNTLGQRISRLAGKTLSFSKKPENHISAIWYFIHDCNGRC